MGSTATTEAIPERSDGREPWAKFWMKMASEMATRSTCSRLKVGCIIVRDNRVLVSGFNGALPGRQHCDEIGCLVYENHCVRSVHSEENCVAQAALHGVTLENSWAYVTHLPCVRCFKILLAAGVNRVYYKEDYGSTPMTIYQALQGFTRLEQLR